MKNLYIALIVSVALILACGLPTTALVSPTTVPTYEAGHMTYFEPVTITGNVNIRDLDGNKTGGYLPKDSIIWGVCDDEWCYVRGTLYKFWRGCSDHASGYECKSEK